MVRIRSPVPWRVLVLLLVFYLAACAAASPLGAAYLERGAGS